MSEPDFKTWHEQERKADAFLKRDKERGIKEVPIPDCIKPPPSTGGESIREAKRIRVRIQCDMARAGNIVICCCNKKLPLFKAYKCLYCGEWYCEKCAEVHFGQTKQEWLAAKAL